MRSPAIEGLMVRGLHLALKHVIHDMETKTLLMELRRCAIKRWVPCGDMDRWLKIPHSAKVQCGFRATPEECLYIRTCTNTDFGSKVSSKFTFVTFIEQGTVRPISLIYDVQHSKRYHVNCLFNPFLMEHSIFVSDF